jgi:hypothetical protein
MSWFDTGFRRTVPLRTSRRKFQDVARWQLTRWSSTNPMDCMNAWADTGPMNRKPRAFSSFAWAIEHRESVLVGPGRQSRRLEAVEGDAKIGASAEDCDPAESGLQSLEAELFEEGSAVSLGNAPFVVVIAAVEGVVAAPRASCWVRRRAQRKSPCRQLVAVGRSRAATTTGVDGGSMVWIASMITSAGRTPSPRGVGTIDSPSSSFWSVPGDASVRKSRSARGIMDSRIRVK